MKEEKTTMGIDVSKAMLDVCLFPSQENKQFSNDTKGLLLLLRWVKMHQPSLVVFEPSGGYEKALQYKLLDNGIPCAKINARQIRDFARCTGRLAKTDLIDAAMLAQFGATIKPPAMVTGFEHDEYLTELIKRRRQLVGEVAREKCRLEKNPPAIICRSTKRHIKLLEKEIALFNQEIEDFITASDELSEKFNILKSVDGVGNNTAAILIAEMPELGKVGPKPIASLAGLAPHNRDSGNMRGKRMISGGRINVRCALYMATLAAIRKDGPIRQFYTHLKTQGKPSKLALTAAMRKMLIRLNAKLRDEFYLQDKHLIAA